LPVALLGAAVLAGAACAAERTALPAIAAEQTITAIQRMNLLHIPVGFNRKKAPISRVHSAASSYSWTLRGGERFPGCRVPECHRVLAGVGFSLGLKHLAALQRFMYVLNLYPSKLPDPVYAFPAFSTKGGGGAGGDRRSPSAL
jgi:hypothetical protein